MRELREIEVLNRAHQLFASAVTPAAFDTASDRHDAALARAAESNTGAGQHRYRQVAQRSRGDLRAAASTDTALATVVGKAGQDHAAARELTRQVLDAARADAGAPADSPAAQREAIRRTVARLRAQHGHVAAARRRAARRLAILRALRYRRLRRARRFGRIRLAPSNTRAGQAVRAALSRLGRPYVWGATGPEQFDCSGLVQWSYRQAGINLDRTTYDQINNGVAVPRSQIQPGDLVFPHAGHVQLAIGNGMVVEAPRAGATVQISRLGDNIAIRRPLG
jgi:cell wall-associated NlpC family hydrolase